MTSHLQCGFCRPGEIAGFAGPAHSVMRVRFQSDRVIAIGCVFICVDACAKLLQNHEVMRPLVTACCGSSAVISIMRLPGRQVLSSLYDVEMLDTSSAFRSLRQPCERWCIFPISLAWVAVVCGTCSPPKPRL